MAPNPVLTEAIDRVASGSDLSSDDAAAGLREVMGGAASEAQAAGFLIALRTEGGKGGEGAGGGGGEGGGVPERPEQEGGDGRRAGRAGAHDALAGAPGRRG